jgi:HlyD family secretion protein
MGFPLPRAMFFAVLLGSAATSPVLAQDKPASTAPPPPLVSVTRAAEREIVARVVVTGTLVPREEILVAVETEGLRIIELLVEEGARVEKGQVLARLDRAAVEIQLAQNAASLARTEAAIAQARSQIVQAEAANVEAEKSLERTRALIRSGNTTEALLEQRVSAAQAATGRLSAAREGLAIAEAEKAAAEAARREIALRLARTEVKAPTAGVVSRRTARVGATASAAGDPLFRLIADGEIELEAEVTETHLPQIREGAPATVAIDGGKDVEGRVRIIYPEIDRATRLGRLRIALPETVTPRIGAFARGAVETGRNRGVAIPLSAIVYGREGPTVLVVAKETVEARRVKPGLQSNGIIEIQDGVKAGEYVVTRAGSFLRDGDKVRPASAETAGAQETR